VSRRTSTLLVALAAALVRVLYFTEHLAAPLVDRPVLDAHYFDLAARALAAGESAPGLFTGFRPLLYPRLLAAVYALADDWGLYAALALQHVAGVATALAVAALARHLFVREGAALAAGLVYALGAPPLFFEGELLADALFTAAVAAQLLAFARAEEAGARGEGRRALALALLAGALAAAAARLRPNHLFFLAALPLLLVTGSRRAARRALATAALGGGLAALALLAAGERPLVGRFQLVPGAGGVNLYLGNKRTADGMIPRQDWSVSYAEAYRDSVEVFAEEAYRAERGLPRGAAIDPGALARYWLGRTVEEFAADPGGRLALLGKKALLLAWNEEIPNNRSQRFAAREEVPLLGRLPVGFALLVALALAGASALPRAAAAGGGLGRGALLLFVATHAAGVVLFFVNDRYRLPLWPALAALAGGGVAALAAALAARDGRALARPALAAAAGLVASLPNWTGAQLPHAGRDLRFRATAHLDAGRLDRARADAFAAAALEPDEPASWLLAGEVCAEARDFPCAEQGYRRALALHPGNPEALSALGGLREAAGEFGAAHRLYCAALAAEPGYPLALVAAAWLELRGGRDGEAERHLGSVPTGARADLRYRLAAAELARRRAGASERRIGIHASEAPRATALLAELDRAFDPGALEPCR
jgi:hypothetical protein